MRSPIGCGRERTARGVARMNPPFTRLLRRRLVGESVTHMARGSEMNAVSGCLKDRDVDPLIAVQDLGEVPTGAGDQLGELGDAHSS